MSKIRSVGTPALSCEVTSADWKSIIGRCQNRRKKHFKRSMLQQPARSSPSPNSPYLLCISCSTPSPYEVVVVAAPVVVAVPCELDSRSVLASPVSPLGHRASPIAHHDPPRRHEKRCIQDACGAKAFSLAFPKSGVRGRGTLSRLGIGGSGSRLQNGGLAVGMGSLPPLGPECLHPMHLE